jgi:hypothetical protein
LASSASGENPTYVFRRVSVVGVVRVSKNIAAKRCSRPKLANNRVLSLSVRDDIRALIRAKEIRTGSGALKVGLSEKSPSREIALDGALK